MHLSMANLEYVGNILFRYCLQMYDAMDNLAVFSACLDQPVYLEAS